MSICWFCEKRQSDLNFEVVMRKETLGEFNGYKKTYKLTDIIVPIPCCAICASIHRWIRKIRNNYIGLSALAVLIPFLIVAIFFKTFTKTNISVGLLILIVAGLFGLSVVAGELFLYTRRKKKWPEEFGKSKIKLDSAPTLSRHPDVQKKNKLGFKIEETDTKKRNKKK